MNGSKRKYVDTSNYKRSVDSVVELFLGLLEEVRELLIQLKEEVNSSNNET